MKGQTGTAMSNSTSVLWATINARQAYQNRKLNGQIWLKNCSMARQNAKLRRAKENEAGLERSHALTDINRKIIKKKMMTTKEAYVRNKTTKPFGMFWVLCG